MQIRRSTRCLLLFVLLAGTCILVTYGKGGRGGGSRGGSRSSSSSRYSSTRYRPAPSYTYRPAPSYTYRPPPSYTYRPPPSYTYRPPPSYTYRPPPSYTYRPAPAPTFRPAPASPRPPSVASPKPPAPNEAVVVKQPAQNPNFKEINTNQGASNPQQPAYNPNYKPDVSPGGAPPPYSPVGQPVPSAPVGPPPPYGSPGHRPPSPPSGQAPPPYPGNPGYPPAYPGLPPQPGQPGGYPNQPGSYLNQPGGYPNQPVLNRPYPVQPGSQPGGYPNHPGGNRPYPVQPGNYPNQPGVSYPNQPNRPYPVQPGSYPGSYSGSNRPYPVQPGFPGGRPYPQQPLGGNVWQPQSGRPAPVYMNYGGLPTGTNMYTKPHKQKGFLGSLMSVGGSKHQVKKNKYYGSYPSPYGMGYMSGGKYGHMGGGSFLGKHESAAMYTILPYMAMKKGSKLFRPRFGFMPYYRPMPHFHHYHGYYGGGMYPGHTHYYDITNNDYIGKCQRPLKRDHSEMKCKSDYNELECQSKCEDGYKFANKLEVQAHKCWHITGVWRPTKNFPECIPICEEACEHGGKCIRPGVCSCEVEYRGDRCQFHFLKCDARHIIQKGDLQVGFVCSHAKNETTCKIHCKEPAVFETPSTNEFKCTPEGKWTPDSVPRCVIKDAEKVEKAAETT